jgi:hypothetical protein
MSKRTHRLVLASIVCLTEAIRLAHDLLGMIFNYSPIYDASLVHEVST